MINNGIGWMNMINQYEPWFENLLSNIIKDEETVFLDVGANIGQTLLKVVPLYKNVQYIEIGPNENCVSYLRNLVKKTGLSR